MSWSFEQPLWFLAALAAAAGLAWYRRAGRGLALPRARDGAGAPRSARQKAARAVFAVKLAGLVLLGAALAGPQRAAQRSTVEEGGVDVLVLLDGSSSMGQPDPRFGKSRLLVAKEALEHFARARRDARLGLVVFARYPRLRCPLTRDREAFEQLLAETVTAAPGGDEDRTAIGAALAFAARVLRASPSPQKLVLLLTDAENNVEAIRPDEAALLCAEEGARVYAGFVGDDPGRAAALELLAAQAGGTAARVEDAAALERFLDAVGLAAAAVDVRREILVQQPLRRACAGVAGLLLALLFVLERTSFVRFP